MQDVRIMPFLQNLHLFFLSRNTGQCLVSSVLEQLLGLGVTTRRPFPSVTSSNDYLFGGRPKGLSTVHQQSYLKTSIEPFDFS